ncbi:MULTISPECIES: glutamate--cysteine ligase [unclassified Crossiella]|uniref:carboxylate-amine ligase n=1 Tax=unclassified Crossiella TaxID=2620835 RepID=UPI001FFFC421|nr:MULTISPECIES: glutamate--cysteine ligase [unclassified Crossiella]MCK2238528.1 glutamate--cysteine ligase [Crossiella sp. S99.2]MCK2251902.1 glutamate--cysteine ligase [Crossiella sp. S99.1]
MTLTVGVEEEFLLVDPASGRPIRAAGAVLDRAASFESGHLHTELMNTQVEAATGVCAGLTELGAQLTEARTCLDAAARAEGLLLLSTGTPVLDGAPPGLAEGERFAEIGLRYAGIAADFQVSGCHVHVGVPDRETAVAVLNHVRPWLPTLLALAGNSVFWAGRDTGYASWRTVCQSRFPGSGLPPRFDSAAEYDAEVARLVDCGVLVDPEMTFWLLRPSPRYPTLEFRVADAVPTAADALLQAALSRALVHTGLSEVDAGRPAPALGEQVAAAALWSAARYGLRGLAVHPIYEERLPATDLLTELLNWVRPALAELGDLELVRSLLELVRTRGIGADRQRAAAAGGPDAVLDLLAAEVVRSEQPALI